MTSEKLLHRSDNEYSSVYCVDLLFAHILWFIFDVTSLLLPVVTLLKMVEKKSITQNDVEYDKNKIYYIIAQGIPLSETKRNQVVEKE